MLTFYFISGFLNISFFFGIELFVLEFILFFNKEKYLKNYRKMLLAFLLYVAIILFVPSFIPGIKNIALDVFYESLILLFICISCTSIFYFGTGFSLNKTIFYAGVSYAIQHLTYSIVSLIQLLITNKFDGVDVLTMQNIFEAPIIAILIVFSIFLRKKLVLISDVELDRRSLSLIVVIIIVVNIILSTLCQLTIAMPAFNNEDLKLTRALVILLEKCYSVICCVLILYIELSLIKMRYLENRLKIGEFLTQVDKENYKLRKKSLEESKIIFHDLNHILNDLEGKIGTDTINDYKKRIESLTSYQKTGNLALDVVLNEEIKRAKENDIAISYIGNGKIISFMNESDIYALFLNIIDNAIEALMKVDSIDKKTIYLTIRSKNQMVFITCENYFENKLVKDHNIYLTTKNDNKYHGYGLQSISNVVKKYNGNVVFSNDKEIFKVSILFTDARIKES